MLFRRFSKIRMAVRPGKTFMQNDGLLDNVSWVNTLLIDRNTPTTLYATTDLGLLRSTDGAVTFVPTGLANTPVAFLAIDPVIWPVRAMGSSGAPTVELPGPPSTSA
jgi:hypothetical protein